MREVSVTEERKPERDTKKRSPDQIVGSNCCAVFFYNIPSGSLMISIPGFVLLICGAAMTGFIDYSRSWIDGLALIAVICLAIGGVWTLGAVIYWLGFWCRDKPPMPRRIKRHSVAAIDNVDSVNLQAVYTYPAYDNAALSTQDEVKHMATSNVDEPSSSHSVEVHSEPVFTVP